MERVITPNHHEAIISKKLNFINITRLELENKVKCIYIYIYIYIYKYINAKIDFKQKINRKER